MKILVLSQYWSPENGVPQRRWSWLTELLVEAGHEVSAITPPPHYEREISIFEWAECLFFKRRSIEVGMNGESIFRSGFFPSGNSIAKKIANQGIVAISMLWKGLTDKSLRKNKPDLIIGTVPAIPTCFITPVLAQRMKIPYVIDLRDSWPELLQEGERWNIALGEEPGGRRRTVAILFRAMSKIVENLMYLSFKRASGMIFTSKRHEEKIAEMAQLQNRSFRTVTIRNVFPAKANVAQPSSRKVKHEPLKVLYAGTLGRAQHLVNAFHAAALVEAEGYEINLRLVGAGAASRELRRMVDENRWPGEILGKVPPNELVEHYAWADTALVHLTNWKSLEHAVPSKVYELMEIGVHITGVIGGETAELIRSLECGDVVDPENPEELAKLWIGLAKDPERLRISESAKCWVTRERNEIVPEELSKFLMELSNR